MKYLLVLGLLVVIVLSVRPKKIAKAAPEEFVTQARIDAVVQSTSSKVLLYFWKPDCPGCIQMGPIVDEVAKEYPNIQVIKINTLDEKNRPVHDAYAIHSTPSFILIQNGKTLGRFERPFWDKKDYLSFLRPSKVY